MRSSGHDRDGRVGPERMVAEDEVEREVLRMLWTFHWTSTAQLTRLVWGSNTGRHRTRLRPILQRLYANNLIWRTTWRFLPGYRAQQRGAVSGGWFYGLTELGKAQAAARLPALTMMHCMTREDYLSATERRTLLHSGHYTEWCTGLIEELRRHPATAGVFVETESTALGRHLRMDGLIRLRLRQASQGVAGAVERPPWFVPWLPGLRAPLVPGLVDVTLALEIDEGTEHLAVIEGKGENYRRTYLGGMQLPDASGAVAFPSVAWDQVLCPANAPTDLHSRRLFFPITVLVVLGPQRLVNTWEAWQRGWSGSEVRMTSWQHIHEAGSIVRAPYVNQRQEWVGLLGHPHPYDGRLPWSTR